MARNKKKNSFFSLSLKKYFFLHSLRCKTKGEKILQELRILYFFDHRREKYLQDGHNPRIKYEVVHLYTT